MSSLRLAAPRASLALHSRQLRLRLVPRHASSSTKPPPPKPRLLEKPERFNPPSHPSRIRSKPRYYGPDLSDHERQAQKTRQYPHMMPPEGSFMHSFLTSRTLHVFITLSILITLAVAAFFEDFLHRTPYRDLLPPNSLLLSHPFSFMSRWIEVYQMTIAYTTQQTMERRKQKLDDVAKRAEYRKAHGIEQKSWFSGWMGGANAEATSPVTKDGEGIGGDGETSNAVAPSNNAPPDAGSMYVDFEGKTHVIPPRKKLFGIF